MKYMAENAGQFFAFNVWDINSAKAIIDAATELKRAVILQTSARVFSALDKNEFRIYINSYAKRRGIGVYLHLDHCRNLEIIDEAIQSGWDSVMIDASHLPIYDNIAMTNTVSKMAKKHKVLVEAEIGQIKGTEEDLSVENEVIANIEEVEKFLQETQVDMLAVAIGTAHGVYKGIPQIHYDMIAKVGNLTDIAFVVHGGTGLADDVLLKMFSYKNVKKINISTEVKQAYRSAILECEEKGFLQRGGFEAVKIEKTIHDYIMQMARQKMRLLSL
ncbi:MAG: gatY [Massilibacillus sp.]|jgi:ketose-bisphosphate aldolase|nr:gatY [Massilibacillus sp.]